jgi:hypothetical protein
MTTITDTNAYWDAVRNHLADDRIFGGHPVPVVDTYGSIARDYRTRVDRNALCSQYSWTVTDPDTVEFVREHAGPMLIDPLAGSGWWAWLLGQDHVDVLASDENPPNGTSDNNWHRGSAHVQIARMDAVDAVAQANQSRTLLLSWPPYDSDIGARILDAYRGNRVIYIGETAGGCCGDDRMFDLLDQGWQEIADHRPIQYYGIRDWVTVYQRKDAL